MNTLTWMIYFADVSGSLDVACGFGIGLTCLSIFTVAFKRGLDDESPVLPKDWLKRGIITVSVLGFLAVLSPSKETVYAMAASEVGEQALKSPIVTKATKALEAWIDSKIPKDEPKK